MKHLFLILVFVFYSIIALCADRYFINPGGNVNWDNATGTTYWSTSSGGAGGASQPTSADNVFFDANSGTSLVTAVYTEAICATINFTGYTGDIAGTIQGYGDAILVSGITTSLGLEFYGGGTRSLTTGGNTGLDFYFGAGSGNWTLQDNIVGGANFQQAAGTFDANNKNITVGTSSTGNITMGSGTWTITSSGSSWSVGTVTANTSTLKFTNTSNNNITFSGGGQTYNNVRFERGASTGTNTITGNNTFGGVLVDIGTVSHNFNIGTTTQTITGATLGIQGDDCTNKIKITGGGTFTKTSGSPQLLYVEIENTAFTGGATWTAEYATDLGGNSGITFNGLYGCLKKYLHFFKP